MSPTAKETALLNSVFGLPAHPLIVHAAVVFIPLAALFGILYAVWPGVRRHIWWAVVGLGVLAPLSAWAARISGTSFRQQKIDEGAAGAFLDGINRHQSFGIPTSWWATGLGVALLAMALYALPYKGADRPFVLRVASAVVTVAVAGVAVYYVIRTGDSGAHSVWG